MGSKMTAASVTAKMYRLRPVGVLLDRVSHDRSPGRVTPLRASTQRISAGTDSCICPLRHHGGGKKKRALPEVQPRGADQVAEAQVVARPGGDVVFRRVDQVGPAEDDGEPGTFRSCTPIASISWCACW